ncbi:MULTISPECIES: hydratase [unclassified Rhizobium]|uniref:2-keto-4-pentenoate hydratase n=1 Tax=unclassified Rhizobium TaxID=2613769 RepID=UPI00160BA64B|nr:MULTISPECIES: hydratase [unclassified Rhizobium]MBB3399420.1 2-oxo-3-hexenedioate decarboxylase/2-keto-4-pentenoate hydratase [Rhizobium sp. BK060]MBB4167725.1 2-oxo-3-hexenedioate decarboxylase/2-keto-4-pentenoate hydratase [Rhizobium sp. BK538]
MYFELKDATGDILAKSRRREDVCDLPLNLIASEKEAYDIQSIAQEALGFERKGYAIIGTSDASRQTLGLTTPIYSEIPASYLLEGVKEFRLPPETIGVQCEFVFTMRRSYSEAGELIDSRTASDAILACRPAIGIIGRRTRRTFNGDYAAIADFGLHVATICGDPAPDVRLGDVAKIDVTTFLFKQTVFSGKATSVMGDPLNAVAWLAAELAAKGRQLEPNDVIATGSCTKILQVWAGQHLAADFGPLGQIECVFT